MGNKFLTSVITQISHPQFTLHGRKTLYQKLLQHMVCVIQYHLHYHHLEIKLWMVTRHILHNHFLCCIITTKAIHRDKIIALEHFGLKVLALLHSVLIQQYRSHSFILQKVQYCTVLYASLYSRSLNILGRKSGILNIFLYKISVLYYEDKRGFVVLSQLQLPSSKRRRQGNCQMPPAGTVWNDNIGVVLENSYQYCLHSIYRCIPLWPAWLVIFDQVYPPPLALSSLCFVPRPGKAHKSPVFKWSW